MKEIYHTFQPYKLYIPSFFSEDSERLTNKLWWWMCRLRFWKYKMNYHHNFLVQINNYTRPKHFEEDYRRASTWGETIGKLKNIAKGRS